MGANQQLVGQKERIFADFRGECRGAIRPSSCISGTTRGINEFRLFRISSVSAINAVHTPMGRGKDIALSHV